MWKRGIVDEKVREEELVVKKIDHTTSLSDAVHRELWSTNVNCFDSCFCSHHWTDCGATEAVLSHHEVLNWYLRLSLGSQDSEYCCTYRVCHISLIGVNFQDNTVMDLWVMLGLVLLWIIWMDSMSHVSWDEVAPTNGSVIFFLWRVFLEIEEDSLSGFN